MSSQDSSEFPCKWDTIEKLPENPPTQCCWAIKGKKCSFCWRIRHIYGKMLQRCFNPKYTSFCWYGARGITVCEEWRNSFHAFRKWAISNGYDPKLVLDRKNTLGHYFPENCRWVNRQQNSWNQRLHDKSTSGYKGVYWDKERLQWCCHIHLNDRGIFLGRFQNKEAAGRAYDAAALRLFGKEFAHLNFPEVNDERDCPNDGCGTSPRNDEAH
jgi:hypothetical protein